VGRRLPEKAQRDLCLAVWDEKNERLFMARDRIGVKPLFLLQ
jgi:asparagine synthetase B (glutamine-hydrolysing)